MSGQDPSKYWQVPKRGLWEWLFMRLCFAAVTWWSLPVLSAMVDLKEQPYPTGLAEVMGPDLLFQSASLLELLLHFLYGLAYLCGGIFSTAGYSDHCLRSYRDDHPLQFAGGDPSCLPTDFVDPAGAVDGVLDTLGEESMQEVTAGFAWRQAMA